MNYLDLIDNYKEDMLKDLRSILAIKSVVGEAEGTAPFGAGVQQVFEAMLELGHRDGFDTKNVDNYGGHIEWKGRGDGMMAVIGHLDVVPEGDGWEYDPYAGTIAGDKLFGRGAIDDKGPVMAAYYAMKALKASGFQPQKSVRLILGLDEECEWVGMKYYMEREQAPDLGFSPDADFPVIHCEKGLMIFDVVKDRETHVGSGARLVSIEGGNASNMVADKAAAVITGIDPTQVIADYRAKSGRDIICEQEGQQFCIRAKGLSAHGAMPEKGVNAITILMEALGRLTFDSEEINQFIDFYNRTIGFDYNGQRFGCGFSDEPSGKLNFNVGILKIDEKEIRLTINIRYPATMTEEAVYEGIRTVTDPMSYRIERLDHAGPLYVAQDHPLVQTLMGVYQEFTGDVESKPLVIGGATFARTVPNSVAFGPVFPGEDAVEHQPNEYISISGMVKAAKIFAEAIYRLTK